MAKRATDPKVRPSARQRAIASAQLRRQATAATSPALNESVQSTDGRLAAARSEINRLKAQLRHERTPGNGDDEDDPSYAATLRASKPDARRLRFPVHQPDRSPSRAELAAASCATGTVPLSTAAPDAITKHDTPKLQDKAHHISWERQFRVVLMGADPNAIMLIADNPLAAADKLTEVEYVHANLLLFTLLVKAFVADFCAAYFVTVPDGHGLGVWQRYRDDVDGYIQGAIDDCTDRIRNVRQHHSESLDAFGLCLEALHARLIQLGGHVDMHVLATPYRSGLRMPRYEAIVTALALNEDAPLRALIAVAKCVDAVLKTTSLAMPL